MYFVNIVSLMNWLFENQEPDIILFELYLRRWTIKNQNNKTVYSVTTFNSYLIYKNLMTKLVKKTTSLKSLFHSINMSCRQNQLHPSLWLCHPGGERTLHESMDSATICAAYLPASFLGADIFNICSVWHVFVML